MSKPLDYRLAKVARPPEGSAWLWHTIELRASPAWCSRSPQLAKLIELLELEHLRHGGAENGYLRQTYSQIEAGGVARKFIAATIAEGEDLGLLVPSHGMRMNKTESQMTTFRLTYLAAKTEDQQFQRAYYVAPTNDWNAVSPEAAASIAEKARERRAKATNGKRIIRCPEREPIQFPNGNFTGSPKGTGNGEILENIGSNIAPPVPEQEHPSISWGDIASPAPVPTSIDGVAIKAERERRKLSLRAVASMAAVSHNAVALVEKGKLNGAALKSVAAALNMIHGVP